MTPSSDTLVPPLESAARKIYFVTFLLIGLALWNGVHGAATIKNYLLFTCAITLAVFSAGSFVTNGLKKITGDPFLLIAAVYLLLLIGEYWYGTRTELGYDAVVPQIGSILAFFAFITIYRWKDRHGLLRLVVALTLFCSLYGILQYYQLDFISWSWNDDRFRVVSFFGHKNFFGAFLDLMIPLVAFAGMTAKTKIAKFSAGITFVLSLAALVCTHSRGAVGAFLTGTLIVGVIGLLSKKPTSLPLRHWMIAGAGFAILLLALEGRTASDYASLMDQGDFGGRTSVYRAAAEVIGRNPFGGTGPGNLQLAHILNTTNRYSPQGADWILDNAHNDFLHLWAEYGLAALLLYIALWFLLFRRLFHGIRRAQSEEKRLLHFVVLWSLLGYLVQSMVTVTVQITSSVFYFWFMVGFFSIAATDEKDAGLTPGFSSSRARYLVPLLLLAWCGTTYFTGLRILSDYYTMEAIAEAGEYPAQALADLRTARSLNRHNVQAAYQEGTLLYFQGKTDSAIKAFQSVEPLAPNYQLVHYNLASCYYRQKNWPMAIRSAKRSAALFPLHEKSLALAAVASYFANEPESARVYARRVLGINSQNRDMLRLDSAVSGRTSPPNDY